MNRREDFSRILRHLQPERVFIDFGGNPLSTMEGKSADALLKYLGLPPQDAIPPSLFGKTRRLDPRIQAHYDTDTRAVGGILTPEDSQFSMLGATEYVDEWGIRRIFTGLYWEAVNTPLRDATLEDLERYRWPKADSIPQEELARIEAQAKYLYEETDYVICAEHPVYGIFELGCWMCGFDDFLYRVLAEPEFVHRFFELVLEYQKSVIQQYYARIGHYIHYTSSGDDFATQNSLFLSPESFRELIVPYFKERVQYTKQFTKAAFLHHSCGSVYPIIPDLIDAGVDILNPIQPAATGMDLKRLKKEFGSNIVFHGGIDTQQILPSGDMGKIENAVKETIEIMNENGGYIFAAAHNIQEDVLPQSLDCMLKTARG